MRILLVSLISPFEGSFGAQQRTLLLYRALTRMGDVDIVVLQPGDTYSIKPGKHPIKAEASWRAGPLAVGGLQADTRLTEQLWHYIDINDYDLVVGRYISALSKLHIPRDIPVVVDLDDAHYRFEKPFYADPTHLPLRLKAWIKRRCTERTIKRYQGGFFVSENDRGSFRDFPGVLLPNIPNAYDPSPDFRTTNRSILFVGSLWYGPNKEGVERYLRHSWPRIHSAAPDAELMLAGAADTRQIETWNTIPGVTALGFVDDLAELYRRSAFTIAPIHYGGGSNIKVLESFAYGRCSVTTRFCASAFGSLFNRNMDLCVCNDDNEITASCLRLLADQDEREARARSGYEAVRNNLNEAQFDNTVATYIQAILK